MNDSKKSALQKIKEAREGGIKRTDQYEVSPSSLRRVNTGIDESMYRSKNKLACSRNSIKKSMMRGS